MLEMNGSVSEPTTIGMVSTFPPTRCGIGRYTASLVDALVDVDRALDLQVIRVKCGGGPDMPGSDVVMEVDPNSDVGVRAAARHLNRCDLTIVQHEYGIYGSDDGSAVVDMVEALETPTLVVLHTVIPAPSPRQRAIVESIARNAVLVVLCESAATLLMDRYSVSPESIRVIRHGAQWTAQPANHQPRRRLITWGLLGPGKGIERSIEALTLLRDIDPPIRYQIVGRIHPAVVARDGYGYRRFLQDRVDRLGVSHLVEFVDRYVSDEELFDLVRRSDVVVVPYDNHDQVSSGVITEAVGLARPVVATRFPHSEEILAPGAGVVVDHDPESLAAGIRLLLEDPMAYRRACQAATDLSDDLSWGSVAREYSQLIHSLSPAVATA